MAFYKAFNHIESTFIHIDMYYRKIFFDFKELDIFKNPKLFIH